MTEPVLVERRNGVQWITLNRPERRNAINQDVIRRIGEGIGDAVADRDCRAIVLTGAGDKAFCAGGDLQKNADGNPFGVDYSRPQHYMVELFKRIQDCTLPIVARVNGHALAGGFGLLCACDMAVAADDIRIGAPESRIGMTPMTILPYMLRVIPARRLQEICITGESFCAQDGLDWGILNYVVPRAQLDGKLDWLLARVTGGSPTAVRLGKQTFNAMRDMSLRDALEYSQAMFAAMASTADALEGRASFIEKRAPNYAGG
ncbi:enoyl-CoA hydratase-related protein [Panacagrimonas sp.]|uniref:enoyl-CoA hydratase-related protein n=1 Tax=Panacagrimonas sp. TaxID=2480088 RepID=UPI003B522532